MVSLLKVELKRIKTEGYKILKRNAESITKLEYKWKQYKMAMSDDIDWMNPKSSSEPLSRSFTDFTKPLPLVGHDGIKKLPIKDFFNRVLDYLMHGTKERKYALSLIDICLLVFLMS
ncbi:hypothetical protein Tco_1547074 [Tanacetum coccineum]